jgi:hypothetical protein
VPAARAAVPELAGNAALVEAALDLGTSASCTASGKHNMFFMDEHRYWDFIVHIQVEQKQRVSLYLCYVKCFAEMRLTAWIQSFDLKDRIIKEVYYVSHESETIFEISWLDECNPLQSMRI